MTTTDSPLSRADRLDRLPFTREHGRLVVGSGMGWALDAMDVGLISFVMAALAVQWQLSPTELSWIGSIGFVNAVRRRVARWGAGRLAVALAPARVVCLVLSDVPGHPSSLVGTTK